MNEKNLKKEEAKMKIRTEDYMDGFREGFRKGYAEGYNDGQITAEWRDKKVKETREWYG